MRRFPFFLLTLSLFNFLLSLFLPLFSSLFLLPCLCLIVARSVCLLGDDGITRMVVPAHAGGPDADETGMHAEGGQGLSIGDVVKVKIAFAVHFHLVTF